MQKTLEMNPDLILLDIGLPTMNGIEAAKIIRQRSPRSKVIFVTQDGDGEVRDAAMGTGAMGTGAMGYVVTARTQHELVDAITTALNHAQTAGSE